MISATWGIARAAIICGLAASLLSAARSAPTAQNYPNHPIRLIVPFAPGGLNDTVARLLQPHLEKSLKVSVIIDNRPAASGIVGTETVAKAQPDGYTLLMVASSHTVIPATNPKLPYDADKSFAPIAMVGQNPFLFIVNAKVPAATLGEFVALAKAKPGKINYATVGAASQSHLITELFSQRAGIKMQQIPYRGGAPAITATVAGETQFTIISPQASLPHIAAGTLRAIAAGSLARDPQFPNIPTVSEQGYPGFEAIQWVGLLTAAGTPKAVIDRLNREVNTAIRDPDLIAKLATQGMSPAGGTAEEFHNVIATEIANWTAVARAAHITAD
ncbi:MAG TPA: tripartite tricarboxylate transporter substrate binding protein [Xanthobacteraceae bacterium]|jgi:tripartite-type tricarboxylate transporter receptor subunit TctC